ncbi:hypothetical protein EDC04DRAFT_2743969 [Pisolithus marmoratus]|nr:hypothetical protein EDC04DRAFT_2743969 [Pisolithus marmoratus]
MLLLTESTLFWLNLTWNALSARESPKDKVQHWVNCVSVEKTPRFNGIRPPPTSAVPPLTTGSTTFVSSNPGPEVRTTLSSRISCSQHLQSEKDVGANLPYGCRRIRRPTSLPH